MYYIAFPNDSRFPKCFVYGIYILDAVQTFIVTSDVFLIYAKYYGETDQLNAMHNEWIAVPIFSGIGTSSFASKSRPRLNPITVSSSVQIYYAYRIGYLSGSTLLMAVIAIVRIRYRAELRQTDLMSHIACPFARNFCNRHRHTVFNIG